MVYPNDAAPSGSEMLLAHTDVNEKSYEGFVRLDFKTSVFDKSLTGGVGVRVAHVKTESSGFTTTDNIAFTPVSVDNDYTDVLPSLNAVLHLTDQQYLRFGASIAISRPPLDALVNGISIRNLCWRWRASSRT